MFNNLATRKRARNKGFSFIISSNFSFQAFPFLKIEYVILSSFCSTSLLDQTKEWSSNRDKSGKSPTLFRFLKDGFNSDWGRSWNSPYYSYMKATRHQAILLIHKFKFAISFGTISFFWITHKKYKVFKVLLINSYLFNNIIFI